MAFEEEFSVEVPDEDAEKLQTVGDVINYIEERAKQQGQTESSSFKISRNTASAVFFCFHGCASAWQPRLGGMNLTFWNDRSFTWAVITFRSSG